MDYNVKAESFGVLDNFVIVLRKGETTLTIEAEDQITSKHYECELSDDVITGLTENFYNKTQELYDGLIASLEKPEDTALSISQDAKLTFVHKTRIGRSEKVFRFVIPLEEKRTVSIETLQRKIAWMSAGYEKKIMEMQSEIVSLKTTNASLAAGLAEYEKIIMEKIEMKPQNGSAGNEKITELVREVMSLKATNANLEARVAEYQRIIMEKAEMKPQNPQNADDCKFISPCYDSKGKLISKFNLSKDKKTIARTQDQGPWYPILAEENLPKKGKVKFITKIMGTAARDIMVGLVTGGLKDNVNPHERVGCYFFTVGANGVWCNGAWRDTPDKDIVKTGDVITVIVDLDNNQVIFELNGVRKRDMSIVPSHKEDLYPCFACYAITDSVMFL